MGLFFRKVRIFGRFPLVRLFQLKDNPKYLWHMLKKNLVYKREKTDFSQFYQDFTFLTGQETLEELIHSGKSLARFSDGEIDQITGAGIYPPDSDWSQRWSQPLQDDIITCLSSDDPRLLVAFTPPSTFLAPSDARFDIRFEWNMWVDMRRLLWRFLVPGATYGHSFLFIKQNCPDVDWDMLRGYWQDKHIIVATGRIEKIQHLNLGLKTYFIECGTDNAYQRKENIKEQIMRTIIKNDLPKDQTIVCASLGPTAGIIAHQMLDHDIRVWDTGHMFEFAANHFLENIFETRKHI